MKVEDERLVFSFIILALLMALGFGWHLHTLDKDNALLTQRLEFQDVEIARLKGEDKGKPVSITGIFVETLPPTSLPSQPEEVSPIFSEL